jgi:hypothetical protein
MYTDNFRRSPISLLKKSVWGAIMGSINPVSWMSWLYGKWFVGHQYIGFVVVLAICGMGLWLMWSMAIDKYNEEQQKSTTAISLPVQTLDRSKVNLFLAHAYGYRGATSTSPREEDRHRHIVSSEPFVLQTNKLNFAFGADNTSDVALRHARITFKYLGQIPLSIVRTHTNESGHFWQEYLPGTQYFYDFGLINGGWAHSWGALEIIFPKPGEYRFDLELTSEEIPGIDPLKTYLRIVVDESAFSKKKKTR